MAAEMEKLIRESLDNLPDNHPDRRFLQGQAEVFASFNARKNGSIETGNLDIDSEWKRQSNHFVDLDFHKQLKQSRQQYLESLPQFGSQPEEYAGRFDVPLLVEVRIPWVKQAELADIAVSDYLKSRLNETQPASDRFKTPDHVHTGWFNKWSQRFPKPIKPFDARDQLKDDEVGAGPQEGIAQQVHHPEVVKSGKYFDLIGYNVGSGYVPFLLCWHAQPGLSADWSDDADDDCRPLVRGSKIVTG